MRNFSPRSGLQFLLWFVLLRYVTSDCLLPELDFPDGTVKLPELVYDEANQTVVEELSILQFKCNADYLLTGHEFLQCDDEEWTSEVPFCVGLKCPRPPSIENATPEVKSGPSVSPVVGSLAVYTCKDGHMLENLDASTLRCSLNLGSRSTSWEGEKPVCKEKSSCPDPGVSVNGNRRGECCMTGDRLRYTCDDGYELVGHWKLSCLRTGIWSSERPLCKPLRRWDYCEFPPPIQHGALKGKKQGDYFLVGDEAQVQCNPGYKCEENEFVLCQQGGGWSHEFGVCKEIFCDPPPPIEHGTILELQTANLTIFPYNFDITYACDKGYRIYAGHSWSSCGKRGWSARTPRCEAIRCPDPGIPENGVKIGSNHSVGSIVRFHCFPGYQLLGSIEMYCKPNGQWTGEVARCNAPSNYCPDPGTPINGFKNLTEYKMGDWVRFRCQPTDFLVGSEFRQCQNDTTWSGTETRCVGRYDFDSRAQVRDMLRVELEEKREEQRRELQKFEEALSTNGTNRLSRILDLNFPGRIILYFAFDVSGSITRPNFARSIDFAKAIIRTVGISPHGALAGAVTFSSKAEEAFLPLNYNSTQDVLDALDRINYTGGGTAANSALNVIRKNYMPLVREWLGDADIKSVIFILTDGKANMGGDPRKEAEILKAEGVEIFCIGITGDVRKKALYDIASTSNYGNEMRPNVFMLQDYSTLAWLVQEITNVTVDYSVCGLALETGGINSGKIVGGNRSRDPWPWMATLYMNEGDDGPESRTLQCGGSIINRNFVLTAAHCLLSSRDYILQAKNVVVKLGLTVLEEKKYLQEIAVRKIHMHQSFADRFLYDSDIALLELVKPIEYNPYVRPICLPPKVLPKDSQFYKPQSIAWALGWGHKSVKPKNDPSVIMSKFLKEIALPLQPLETCRESLRDDYMVPFFSDTMFCAGDGGGNQDTCHGDSGGPMMQTQLNEDGYLTWFQVGIVSWGLGCGLPHEYGFYTHLQKLMPWVDNITGNASK